VNVVARGLVQEKTVHVFHQAYLAQVSVNVWRRTVATTHTRRLDQDDCVSESDDVMESDNDDE